MVDTFGETIQIGDHRIKFPYVPYSCQRDFMAKVVEALDSTANAALESPTGTGKTLSLLCSAIAWVQSQKEKIRLQQHQSQQTSSDGPKNQTPPQTMQQYPKIYYASRTHSQLQQVIRELNKTAYKSAVRVTTLAGRDQLCLNEEVLKEQNKELRAHMCRSLTKHKTCVFHSNMNEVDPDRLDQIYFKKFRGVAMDIEDLVSFAQTHRHCPFYRARHMCKGADLILLPYNYLLDPEVRKIFAIQLKGNILIFDEAHNMESMAEESVSVDFSTRTLSSAINETKSVIEIISGEQIGELNYDDENSRLSTLSSDRLMKKGSITEEGEEEGLVEVEEFEMEQHEEDEADDDEPNRPKLAKLKHLLNKLQSLEKQISELNLQTDGHPLAKQSEKRVVHKAGEPIAQRVFPGLKMIELLKAAGIQRTHRASITMLIDVTCMFLANRPNPGQYWHVRGVALNEFSKLISRVFVDTFDDAQLVTATSAKKTKQRKSTDEKQRTEEEQDAETCRHFKLFVEERLIPVDNQPKWGHQRRGTSGGLTDMSTFGGGLWPNDDNEGATGGLDRKEIQLHYWCFDAAIAMRYIWSRGTRSIIFASGTLAPLDTFLGSMGLEFGAILESAHCAREEQLVVGALEKGPDKVQLLGTFQKRDDLNYKRAIGVLILQVARVTPQGMLVFFPSYAQMANFTRYWQTLRIGKAEGEQLFWPLLERQKQIFTEPQDKPDILNFFREFDLSVRENPGGALLFAVCRGKLSEGIDFADNHCRSVVIVGIPFPPLFDPRVMLKKEHLTEQLSRLRLEQSKAAMNKENVVAEKGTNSNLGTATTFVGKSVQAADDWYKIEGTRAVNQALGRIIRHKDDFGAVILADLRFGTMDRRMFPSWMRGSIKVHATPNSLIPSIQRFFAHRGMKKPAPPPAMEIDRKRRSEENQGDYSTSSSLFADRKMGGGGLSSKNNWQAIKFDDTKSAATAPYKAPFSFTNSQPRPLQNVAKRRSPRGSKGQQTSKMQRLQVDQEHDTVIIDD